MIFIIFILLINVGFSKDKGKAAFDNGNYADARFYYENILRSRENDDAAKYGLGVSAYKQNDIEGALRALKESTNAGDKNLASKSYYNLANILRESGEMEESLKYYKKSILLNPLDKDAKINFELLKQILQQQQDQQQQDQQQQDQQQQDQQQKGQEEKLESSKKKEAEAILNALRDQEKINQKFQIKKATSRKMEKDW